ncbi:MAG: aquaporin [Bacteriovoracaceae bacterium]
MDIKHEPSQYVAEFIGTFFLVFFGCGAIILSQVNPSFNGSLIPIVFGGAVSVMIYSLGHISGAHFNPAVTIAFWACGRFPLKRIPGYALSQVSGAISASFIHKIIWGSAHTFGSTYIQSTVGIGFLVELILSFCLMFVIISVATDSRAIGELAGIAIGSTVSLCAFVGGPVTFASMNPARTLGPAVLTLDFTNLWVYLAAPILGTILAARTYEWIRCQKEKSTDGHGCC